MRAALDGRLREFGKLLVAYSGGVDSAFLAFAAHVALGERMLAVIADSPSLARAQLADAIAFAGEQRIPLEVIATQELERADYSRAIDIARQAPNLLVLRTFSKIYGLAGIRMGYGIGPADLLVELNKLRTPFNTSSVAQAAALAALDDAEHVRRSVEANRAGLRQLADGLTALGVPFVPSVTNFLLVELGEDTKPLSDELLRRGVIVRPMAWMGFPNAIRVSVGTAEENRLFLSALAAVRAARAPKSASEALTPEASGRGEAAS